MAHVCVIGTRGVPSFVGGIETICENLYPTIVGQHQDHRVTILGRLPFEGQTTYSFKGVEVRVLKAPSIKGLETFIHTFIALIYARLKLHPKIVHLHGIGPGFFSFLSRLFGFKTVVTHHSPDYKRPKWRWYGKWILMAGELNTVIFANKVICVSNSLKNDLDKRFSFLKGKRTTIRNAGSLIAHENWPDDKQLLESLNLKPNQYILAVGRLDKTKGFDDLIHAYEASDLTNTKLVIVGSNYEQDDYVLALMQNESERIIFAGTRTGGELVTLYKNASILVNPSYMEGFCLVVAEALSVCLPIIASDIGAHREFELEDACYFTKGDVDALTKKLNTKDYSLFRCRNAEELQSSNTWQLNVDRHVSLYNSLL